jgi:ABC-type transport system substrate-binding protein
MNRISRRQVVRGAAAAAAAMTLDAPAVHAQKGRQTLRFVAQADLKILDPIWTTAYITRNHGYLVYDTLFGTDENFQIKPQMVDQTTVSPDGMKYTFTLRDGLRWHDGPPVLSEDCVESLKRWGKKDRFGQLLMAHTGKITSVDKKTFTLELAERFRPRPRRARKAVEQRALHDAGADCVYASGRADQGDRRLWTVQVREERMATGPAGRVCAEPRLHPTRRDAERINRRQEGVP